MAKKAKKDKKEEEDEVLPEKKDGGKSGKGKKGKPQPKSPSIVSEPVIAEESEPEEPPRKGPYVVFTPTCNDVVPQDNPCRYTEDACCEHEIACRPNIFPGVLKEPVPLAVVGSDSGSYQSLCRLMRAGFCSADRVLMMTPWANFVVIKAPSGESTVYFIFDGCTCKLNRFRFLDLNQGTAGFIYFECLHEAINYMIESREFHDKMNSIKVIQMKSLCEQFCQYKPKKPKQSKRDDDCKKFCA